MATKTNPTKQHIEEQEMKEKTIPCEQTSTIVNLHQDQNQFISLELKATLT